jgi:hypothetical protein
MLPSYFCETTSKQISNHRSLTDRTGRIFGKRKEDKQEESPTHHRHPALLSFFSSFLPPKSLGTDVLLKLRCGSQGAKCEASALPDRRFQHAQKLSGMTGMLWEADALTFTTYLPSHSAPVGNLQCKCHKISG